MKTLPRTRKRKNSGAALDIAILLLAFFTILAGSFISLVTIASKEDLVAARAIERDMQLESALYEFVDFSVVPAGYDIKVNGNANAPKDELASCQEHNTRALVVARLTGSTSGAACFLVIDYTHDGTTLVRTAVAKGETTWTPS